MPVHQARRSADLSHAHCVHHAGLINDDGSQLDAVQ